ncbi:MAG TPA: (2Fe-2S)-binding protein [Trebonia sp.]|jgi:aerobic-type carbon monoxide dehydrogenase small subunit (CoxS/CutS family)|nr:(2Fe-2S)-binding protein [Trebonia sp.]
MTTTTRTVTVTVNGTPRAAETEVRTLLSDFLRHELGLTGTHVGCEQGICGSCTVLLDGDPVRACLLLAVQAEGHEIETVESLADEGSLSGFQRAMRDQHGLQCGFCTSGIVMSVTAAERAGLQEGEVVDEVLGGHVCRCTGYVGIRAAVRQRWEEKASGRPAQSAGSSVWPS